MDSLPDDIRAYITQFGVDTRIMSKERLYQEIITMNPSFDPRGILMLLRQRRNAIKVMSRNDILFKLYWSLPFYREDRNFHSWNLFDIGNKCRIDVRDIDHADVVEILYNMDIEPDDDITHSISINRDQPAFMLREMDKYMMELNILVNNHPIFPKIISLCNEDFNEYSYRSSYMRNNGNIHSDLNDNILLPCAPYEDDICHILEGNFGLSLQSVYNEYQRRIKSLKYASSKKLDKLYESISRSVFYVYYTSEYVEINLDSDYDPISILPKGWTCESNDSFIYKGDDLKQVFISLVDLDMNKYPYFGSDNNHYVSRCISIPDMINSPFPYETNYSIPNDIAERLRDTAIDDDDYLY